jgi:phosphatidylinositol alpha 1,6-mannosyltransferase
MDLLITPGENETFCQVIQEAMASAVPVVAPAIGGPRDLVRDGESGLLYSPGDVAGMVESVNKILNEEQLRITLGRSSRAIVEAKTWPKVCDKLLGHYETVLSNTSISSESVA